MTEHLTVDEVKIMHGIYDLILDWHANRGYPCFFKIWRRLLK